jgi:hypothetical protein
MEIPPSPGYALKRVIIAHGCARYDGAGVRDGTSTSTWCDDGEGTEQSTSMPVKMDAEAEVKVRIALTELMQNAVEVLGRRVSGGSLTGLPHDHHHNHHRT